MKKLGLSIMVLSLTSLPIRSFAQEKCKFQTLDNSRPLVIAHRGASGYRPEHTLAAYQMAMELGADFIEPDLVSTKDGYLVARHEPNIIDTTDVKDHPEFSARRKKKTIDDEATEGYFSGDFTLKEIKTLRAVQSHPYRDGSYNGLYQIPTFEEIVQLVLDFEKRTGRKVGIFPETKHPTYFRKLGLPLEEKLLNVLIASKFTDEKRVYIQSFEVGNLREAFVKLMKEKAVKFPLIQLMGGKDRQPYDFKAAGDKRTYGQMMEKEGLRSISTYAAGIGPWKDTIVLKDKLTTPVDIDGNGTADARQKLSGKATSLVSDAHAAKLLVIPFTIRNEERYGILGYKSVIEEMEVLVGLGVDGLFSDFPDSISVGIDSHCRSIGK